MDKSWIFKAKGSPEFLLGFESFLRFAFENSAKDGKIVCPCTVCYNRFPKTKKEVENDVLSHGFCLGYTHWIDHGENFAEASFSTSPRTLTEPSPQRNYIGEDDIEGLIQDTFMGAAIQNLDAFDDHSFFDEDINIETSAALPEESVSLDAHDSPYKKLIDDAHEELYPGCENYSKLSFTLHLLHLKYMFGWSKHSFDMLVELLLNVFPHITTFPPSFYEAKKVIKELGLVYEKIDACPNDCMLYWNFDTNEPLDAEQCSKCLLSRWKKEKGEHGADETVGGEEEVGQRIKKPKKKAAKVLRYFPLIPRLKRLYSSQKTVEHMIWHEKSRIKDEKLRHPADGKAWKLFDERYEDFASEPRNVRLALASDGFNPFRTLSTSHSTWPVILLPYNLPPWLCMNRSSVIMSMIIPGEKAPGDDIDVYLQPLIAELKELWNGVDAYDACTGQTFTLRAALMWTLNDFPVYANLSGWSTKGKYACPVCGEHTDSTWLKHGRKFCYMGHRRLLPQNHFFRFQADQFNGEVETRCAPIRSSGAKVLEEMEQTTSWQYGKASKVSVRKESQRDIDYDDSSS